MNYFFEFSKQKKKRISLKIKNWYNDPISRIGSLNFFSMILLTLYRSYILIFLTNNLLINILLVTIFVSSINFFQIFTRIPFSELSQAIGRKPLILIGNIFLAYSMLIMYYADDFLLAFASALLFGFGMSSYWPAVFAYIQDVSPKNYGRQNGRIFKFGDLGIIFGSLTAQYLLDSIGIPLRELYLFLFIFGFCAVIIFSFIVPEVINPADKLVVSNYIRFFISSIRNMLISFKNIVTTPGMIRIYIFQFFISFTEFFLSTFFPLIIIFHHYSEGSVSLVIFLGTFFLLWLKPYLGNISDRFGYRSPVLTSLVVVSFFIVLLPFIENFTLLVLIYFIVTACVFVCYPAVNGATANNAPTMQRGVAMGTLGVFTSLGRASSTTTLGVIWEYYGLITVFLFTGLLIILFVILLFISSKRQVGNTLVT
ncbi:MAG: MFS transporter [Candidatus Thorarchaeota archaeon]